MISLVLKLINTADGSSVRAMIGPNGLHLFSVYDFMTISCCYGNSGASARTEFKRMIKEGGRFKDQILALCTKMKFPGKGQRETPCMTVEGLLVLSHCLGDRISQAFKDETLSVLQRYLDGDTTMHAEIDENLRLGKRKSYEKFAGKVAKRAQTNHDTASQEMPPVSYVYGTKSEAFPDLIKIGRAANLPARLSSMNTGCAPLPHVILAAAPTFDSVRDEALAHAHFSSARMQGEFFCVSVEDVRAFFTNTITARYQLELQQHIASLQGQFSP